MEISELYRQLSRASGRNKGSNSDDTDHEVVLTGFAASVTPVRSTGTQRSSALIW